MGLDSPKTYLPCCGCSSLKLHDTATAESAVVRCAQVTEDKKVHGGVPRTVSLPHLDAPGSQDASPEGRLGSALGDCASVPPALPLPSAFAGVRSSSTGGEGVVPGGPVGPPQLGALSIGSAAGRRGGGGRPGSAPLRADAVLTAPYQRSPDWPGEPACCTSPCQLL